MQLNASFSGKSERLMICPVDKPGQAYVWVVLHCLAYCSTTARKEFNDIIQSLVIDERGHLL